YNDKPHGGLYGLLPNESLEGNSPNKDKFKNEIAVSRKNRLLQNQLIECCQSK
ncbi:MAG: hypothetical protein ACI8WP_001187, partial [Flavobacteriaceae bacterium]